MKENQALNPVIELFVDINFCAKLLSRAALAGRRVVVDLTGQYATDSEKTMTRKVSFTDLAHKQMRTRAALQHNSAHTVLLAEVRRITSRGDWRKERWALRENADCFRTSRRDLHTNDRVMWRWRDVLVRFGRIAVAEPPRGPAGEPMLVFLTWQCSMSTGHWPSYDGSVAAQLISWLVEPVQSTFFSG